jgi:DNA repair exonuclease SbcCD nuclease subunit
VAYGLNDFRRIKVGHKKEFTPEIYVEWHNDQVHWIEQEVKAAKENNQKAVVLTHHAPVTIASSDPSYLNQASSSCFTTNLEELVGEPIEVWAYGHTHVHPPSLSSPCLLLIFLHSGFRT